jgi:hypothetical protein
MNLVTSEFVDQVLYYKMQALGLKGSPYLNPVLRELVDCRYYFMGGLVINQFESALEMNQMKEQLAEMEDKLSFLLATENATEREILEAMASSLGMEIEVEDGG